MPDRFTQNELNVIAAGFAASPRASDRILGSQLVKHEERQWQIGLNLYSSTCFEKVGRDQLVKEVIHILNEYRNCCPRIVNWMCNGDYNPDKVPALVSRGEFLHACRSAARLRAALLRVCGQTAL